MSAGVSMVQWIGQRAAGGGRECRPNIPYKPLNSPSCLGQFDEKRHYGACPIKASWYMGM